MQYITGCIGIDLSADKVRAEQHDACVWCVLLGVVGVGGLEVPVQDNNSGVGLDLAAGV